MEKGKSYIDQAIDFINDKDARSFMKNGDSFDTLVQLIHYKGNLSMHKALLMSESLDMKNKELKDTLDKHIEKFGTIELQLNVWIDKLKAYDEIGMLPDDEYETIETKKFETELSENQLTKVYEYLISKKYIETELNNWLSWFNQLNENQKPMKWKEFPQTLSNIFSLICLKGSHKPFHKAFGIEVNKQDSYDKIISRTYGKDIKHRIDTTK